jgi:zinc finger CCCH domain-containing protein 13
MGDRYRHNSGRRSPTFNPARMSMPTMSSGYSSFYGGDIHVMPSSRYESVAPHHSHHHHHRHGSNDWRGPNVPVTTTTYTVRKDPVTRSSSIRENSRTRSSTMDSTTKRPPIIVTTRQSKEPSVSHSAASHHPASPAPDRGRDAYRSSDEDQYYTQPASSIRSRSHSRPYHASGSISSTLDNDEFLRLRQRTNDDRLASSRNGHRRERPSSIYADPPRLSTKTVDLGDTGYEYTKPSDLARYDLDNDKVHTRRRRDSFDRNTYYRPSVNVGADVGRPYEGRARAPPPSRALDNYNRRIAEDTTAGIYDRPSVRMPAPPVIPVPAPDRRSTQLEITPSAVERADRIERRPSRTGHQPVSLYQDVPARVSQPDDLYRTRDDNYAPRDPRDRDYQLDDGVGSRGFGVRVDGDKKDDRIREREREEFTPARERRTEQRRDPRMDDWEREPKRRSDDDLTRREVRKYSRDQGRKEDDYRADRKIGKDDSIRGEDERNRDRDRDRDRDREREKDKDKDKDKIRDKVTTGLSIAAGALGLGAMSHKSKDDEDKERSPKRRADDEVRKDEAEERHKSTRKEADERPAPRDEAEERPRRERVLDDADDKERNRHEAEARLSGEPTMSGARDASSSDESKPRRRQRPSSAFRPNDTAGLMALKEQLKAKEECDKENKKADESSPERHSQPSPSRKGADPSDDIRGREAVAGGDDKQVRVVSPPRDKDDKKPIKGILKQPKVQFPEEPNPVREGVAPHKDDKSKSNVPPGARWTKISRKLVNPEALTIGKERFEVRDDFVIVLRVLNKEEIEAYTAATAQLRGGLLPFHFLS